MKKILQTNNREIIELFVEHGTYVDIDSKLTTIKYHCVYRVKPNTTYTKFCPISLENDNCAIFDDEEKALRHGEKYIAMIYNGVSDYVETDQELQKD
ncbi:hypothetical protein [Microbacter margulisiae]|uniref:Uncharacterized protein n=1 Tax=Microbacter margulisiae TaxID=1350067 RepID=A0A7W5DR55_9PORP|nr:hypothetical protein [Microbacter margulisiae]MBB3187441.1 hypothetical protein [Microbacter margulisiae]